MSTPLFLVSGWNTAPSIWNPLIEALGDSFNVVQARLPGEHDEGSLKEGRGAGRPTDPLESERRSRAADIQGLLASWLDDLWHQAPPNAHWCGWSLGATLSMAAALARPAAISRLTLVCPTPKFCQAEEWDWGAEGRAFEALQRKCQRDPIAGWRRFVGWQMGGPPTPSQWSELQEHRSSAPQWALDEGQRLLLELDLRTRVGDIQVPTDVWAAHEDPIIDPRASQWIARQIPSASWNQVGHNHLLPWFEPNTLAEQLLAGAEALR